ncbi:MAG: extracellular solute-binding protein [Treponema sp.]|jgi:multiple sugar transport system substrate-binding protein|nr:extracellular solute-binding protein [Treponema sp.]
MKRVFFVSMAIVCVAGFVFTACQGKTQGNSSPERLTLNFWEMYGPTCDFDKITDEYNAAHPEVRVIDTYFPSHAELLQRLQVSAAAGSGEKPDVIFYDCIYPTVTDSIYTLVDLRDYFAKDSSFKYEDFYPVFQRFGTAPDGRVISLHTWANCLVLFYNKSIFRAKGLDPDTPPKNWQEMYSYARKIQDTRAGIWGFLGNFVLDNSHEGFGWEWQSQTVSAGGKIWDDTYTHPAFNSSAAVEALTFYTDAFKEGISTISPPEQAFINGLTGMQIAGSWMQNTFSSALGDDLGVGVWPGKNNPAPNVGGEHFMIVKSDETRQQASWEFVKYWFTPKVHLRVARAEGKTPTYKPLEQNSEYAAWLASNDTMKVIAESMNSATNRAVRPDYPTFTEIVFKHIEPVFYGADANAAIQAAFAEVESTMGNR